MKMKKPLIAMTARMGWFEEQYKVYVNQSYYDAISNAGGIPVVVGYGSTEDFEAIADQFDGLLVTGGEDLDPATYHQKKHESVECTDPRLDDMDLQLIRLFDQRKKPIVGICRGIQSINVAFGGDLIQDINTQYSQLREQGHQQYKAVPKVNIESTFHTNTFVKGTLLAELMEETHDVNSYHHQNIDHVADGFKINSWSDDGLAEGFERDNILAVQWHPERLTWDPCHRSIFEVFVKKCTEKE